MVFPHVNVFITTHIQCTLTLGTYTHVHTYNVYSHLAHTRMFTHTMYTHTIHSHTHSCPPRAFIPALCKIFMDAQAPSNVLEVTARALTYYLDVSADCCRRITAVDGALKAIVDRMQSADVSCRTSKDLAEQCVKVGVGHSEKEVALTTQCIV